MERYGKCIVCNGNGKLCINPIQPIEYIPCFTCNETGFSGSAIEHPQYVADWNQTVQDSWSYGREWR